MTISKVITLSRTEKQDLHSVLRRALERAERNKRTAEAEQLAREIAALDNELRTPTDAELCKAYALQPYARRFLLPRETGKPPVDPDAEQLAGQVGTLADEFERGVA